MRKTIAFFLIFIYTFSFSTEVVAIGLNALDNSNKVIIKKQCNKRKYFKIETDRVFTNISTEKNELISFQLIHAICIVGNTPHFTAFSSDFIPYFDSQNCIGISEIYDSPSLLCDPFPPKK